MLYIGLKQLQSFFIQQTTIRLKLTEMWKTNQ